MTPNPTTKGMSEAETISLEDVPAYIEALQARAERAVSALEVRKDWISPETYALTLQAVRVETQRANAAEQQRDEFRAAYAYLMKVAPWSESNDMTASDEIICGIDGILQRANAAESDRSELIAMVQRLLPLSRGELYSSEGHLIDRASTNADAEALLSRITDAEASR
jgi:hypothetical protein